MIVQNDVKFEIPIGHTICSSIVRYTTTSILFKDQTKIWFWGGTNSKWWKGISYVLIYICIMHLSFTTSKYHVHDMTLQTQNLGNQVKVRLTS
jgi:hypothetical protein